MVDSCRRRRALLRQQPNKRRETCQVGLCLRKYLAPFMLFLFLGIQLWVRISAIRRGYELEALRQLALTNDSRLRQLQLEYAYSTSPEVLRQRAKGELAMVALTPQRIRKLERREQG